MAVGGMANIEQSGEIETSVNMWTGFSVFAFEKKERRRYLIILWSWRLYCLGPNTMRMITALGDYYQCSFLLTTYFECFLHSSRKRLFFSGQLNIIRRTCPEESGANQSTSVKTKSSTQLILIFYLKQ